MIQKLFVFRPLSRYICTRRIELPLQNIHVVSFAGNDYVSCCFVGRNLEKIKRSDSVYDNLSPYTHRKKNPKSNVTT